MNIGDLSPLGASNRFFASCVVRSFCCSLFGLCFSALVLPNASAQTMVEGKVGSLTLSYYPNRGGALPSSLPSPIVKDLTGVLEMLSPGSTANPDLVPGSTEMFCVFDPADTTRPPSFRIRSRLVNGGTRSTDLSDQFFVDPSYFVSLQYGSARPASPVAPSARVSLGTLNQKNFLKLRLLSPLGEDVAKSEFFGEWNLSFAVTQEKGTTTELRLPGAATARLSGYFHNATEGDTPASLTIAMNSFQTSSLLPVLSSVLSNRYIDTGSGNPNTVNPVGLDFSVTAPLMGGSVTYQLLRASGGDPLETKSYENPGSNFLVSGLINNPSAGKYVIRISNNFGTVSVPIRVIENAAPQITVPLPSVPLQVAAVTGTVQLSVVAEGTESLAYQWYKDGALLSDGVQLTAGSSAWGTVAGSSTSSLQVSNPAGEAAGRYWVKVSNGYGEITGAPATVVMLAPPVIVQQPGVVAPGSKVVNVNVGMFQPLSLSVQASGPGTLRYQWFKNGAAISGATSSSFAQSRMTPNSKGRYRVAVRNDYGETSSVEVNVDVKDFLGHSVVTVPNTSVAIATQETTIGQWKRFVAETKWAKNYYWQSSVDAATVASSGQSADAFPVAWLSWDDAQEYCAWLSSKSGMTWRLPTEAEWTAATANNEYPWGSVWPPSETSGNYADNGDSFSTLAPVGSFPSAGISLNGATLYDMGGNVAEWMQDAGSYGGSSSTMRSVRGGSYLSLTHINDSLALQESSKLELASRSVNRAAKKSERLKDVGFRVVVVLPWK